MVVSYGRDCPKNDLWNVDQRKWTKKLYEKEKTKAFSQMMTLRDEGARLQTRYGSSVEGGAAVLGGRNKRGMRFTTKPKATLPPCGRLLMP
jgi:hypothetical protein